MHVMHEFVLISSCHAYAYTRFTKLGIIRFKQCSMHVGPEVPLFFFFDATAPESVSQVDVVVAVVGELEFMVNISFTLDVR